MSDHTHRDMFGVVYQLLTRSQYLFVNGTTARDSSHEVFQYEHAVLPV